MHRECVLWTLYDTWIPQKSSWINSGNIIFFSIFDVRGRPRHYSKGSGPRPATALIASERSSKTMGTNVEFVLFHGVHVEISVIKRSQVSKVDDGVWGNLASPGDPEESASHNNYSDIIKLTMSHHSEKLQTWCTPSGRGRGCEALSSR